jgi:hypothetical protein
MVAVAPSIAVITYCFHSWVEYDMLNAGATTLVTFFVISLLYDVFTVHDARSDGKTHVRIMHMNALLLFTLTCAVAIFATTNLPLAPAGDPLNGSMLFTLLVVFLGVYTFTPSIIIENTKATTLHIIFFKEVAEIALRVVFFAVMAFYVQHGIRA